MARLTIKEKEYEAKCSFKFDRLAEKNYNDIDSKGNDTGGFMSIYMGLLQFSNKHLLAFWDCALDHLRKDKPSLADIEAAIEDRIEEDGDTELLFKEAFIAVDESGFYRKQAKKFWKNIELLKDSGKTEKEKEENLKMYNVMDESRKELTE